LDNKDVIPYVLVKNLGHGASAIVEMVRDVTNGQTYARKVFRNIYARNLEEAKVAFRNELRVMRRLKSHHHIIQVFATYIAQRELALILTPVADTGDLATFIQSYRDSDPLDPERERKAATLWKAYGCLASGLAFIYKQTIRHKDIKPKNILIHQGNVLFTDFGISVDFSEHGRSTTTGHPQSFTRKYCAPEVADWDKRNSKSDVFSLGCVYAEILDALQPNILPDALFKGPFHKTLDHLSPRELSLDVPKKQAYHHILELIKGMLAPSIEERMSALDVIAFLPVCLEEIELFCISCVPNREIDRRYWGNLNDDLNIEGAGEDPDPEINMKGPDFGGYGDNIEEQDHPTRATHSAHPPLRALHDQEDGVRRCPMCALELEDGECTQCGPPPDDNGEMTWNDNFTGFSDADEASERDMSGEDPDAEIDMEDADSSYGDNMEDADFSYGDNMEDWQDYLGDEASF